MNLLPLRDRRAILSSARKLAWPGVLLASMAGAATLALQDEGGRTVPPPSSSATPPLPTASTRSDPLWGAIDQWNRLRQSDRLAFGDYAGFLLAHPGWPGEAAMRRAAERAIVPDQVVPGLVVQFLTRFPPTTAAGRMRHAEALQALNRPAEARDAAARAWTAGAMPADEEARFATRFAGQFTQAEQDQRMERLLWDRAVGSATRQLALASPVRQPIYGARLAFQARAADAASKGAALGPGAERDPGFVADRAAWLRDTSQGVAARAYLAQARTLDAPPLVPERYLDVLLTAARGAATDNQPSLTYDIAGHAHDAFPPGADLRAAPLPQRDAYTSLAWLGGWTALKKLARPRDAETMFARYAAAAQTPGSQAKGEYWAGRAALAAGDTVGANAHFTKAAVNVDQFYGQLSLERLGRTIALPADPPPVAVPAGRRTAFAANELVRAARLLGQAGRWQDQTQFVRAIAATATADADHVLVDELARDIGRPDLGVITSRNARASGGRDPIRVGFPTVTVPASMERHWTLMHAIARQESQFDREALSPVGARGLVQLMPATAREQAGKLGLPFQPERLTKDITYNVTIGASYYDRMLTYYGGNHVLAVASYNAGPGNVNKFIRANGDPRLGQVDVIDWIEAIPLSETRTYVQKVLENAVVYDLFNPTRARTPARDRLSHYLGKKTGG